MSANNLKDDLAINPYDLDEEIIRQPGLYAHYAEQLAQARRQLALHRLALDTFVAAIDHMIRDTAFAAGKRLTERQIESQVNSHPDYVARMTRRIEMETAVEQLEGVVRAMAQKKDMIVTFASNLRSERGSSFSIRSNGDVERQSPTIAVVPFSYVERQKSMG